ncbi:MAG: peptidoglycan-binding protein, partial [bacterium]
VREYLPRDCCERLNDGSVVPIAGKENVYDLGLKKLKASVEGEEDPRKRHFFFEQNGTGYIVQRKAAQPHEDAESDDHEEREDDGRRGKGMIIALVAAIVVVAAAAVLFMLFKGPLSGNKDVSETPTLDPGSSVWTPLDSDSPTVTPYTSPTFAALVDPDLTWMDFTFEAVSATASSSAGNAAGATRAAMVTPKPTAVPRVTGDASSYTSIGGNSSQQDVRKLQRKLAELGWLDNGDVTGQYDDATRRAVRDFQRYINQNYDPVTRLDVDGIAGPKTQQWLYQVNAVKPTVAPRVTATPKPTPTPRVRVTVDPDDDTVIDANSSNRQIRAMQLELIALGVMPVGSDSGNFDATTRSAVKRFQTRVNQLQGYEVLEVNGRMDALSMAFLDYYVDEWRALRAGETPTPTPKVTPTPEPKVTPTPASTKYDPERDPSAIGPDSPAEAVKNVQQSLIAIGMLPEGSDDGNFGASTALAIRQFQDWVNRRRNEQTLTVNGEADPLTRAYLRYCIQNGMRPNADEVQIPTPTPTAVPQIDIDPDEEEVIIQRGSDRESIRKLQELLASVGLMSRRGIDGVYGNGTVNAVKAFQEYVNAHGGELEANGLADSATRRTLEYYVENNMTVHDDEEPVTLEPTAEPTALPTPEPTGAPTPIPEPETDPIETARQLLIAVGALSADAGDDEAAMAQAIVDFQNWFNRQGGARVEVTGRLDSGTTQMLELCASQGLRMMPEDISATDTADDEPYSEPTAEVVTTEDAAPFAARIEQLDITIAGQLYESGAMKVEDGNFSVSWAADGDVESYSVYVSDSLGNALIAREGILDTSFNVDAARMQPGEVYTVTIGAKPLGGTEDDIVWQTARFTRPAPAIAEPTPTPLPAANVPEVETPWINIEGIDNGSGLVEINENSLFIRWGANGARSYNVQITDSYG